MRILQKETYRARRRESAVQVCHNIFTLAYLVNKSYILLQSILILQETFEQFQKERDRLLAEVESLNADGQTHKVRDAQLQKLKAFEAQVHKAS
jgi:hypothetical protein